MKRVSQLLIICIAVICSLNKTIAYYNTNDIMSNTFNTKGYSFKLNGNGGTYTDDKVIINNNQTILPVPNRVGYDFVGYSKIKNGVVDYTSDISNVDEINNISLYAKWNTITYSIFYDLVGGTITGQPVNYNIEDELTLPAPSKKGYDFMGWTGTGLSSPTKDVIISNGVGDRSYVANWNLISYSISYNLDGGTITGQPTDYNVEDIFTLPTPTREGYTFAGWTGTGLSSPTKDVVVSKEIGNKNYVANWTKNYYIVNYYVNDSLWNQRTVGYNDNIENLNAQSALDGYHTFHGWNGWLDKMPSYDVNLYANVTEAYCSLTTGHGEYGNATALLNVFRSAGWTGNIINAPSAPKYYMVKTDYNLTRAQAEVQKNYIASHTNYTNYNFPYLYWVSVDCTNGYGEAWTRSLGQSSFN